ncbi:MAG TPA: LytTR family DNA-binding domain-containing protein [Gammaproteobacteria bacterium]|jgi:two-component system response regulator AlgR|nr:LytTR family DNA-binding domain-containing protein [Gammaproteobacteria bacterium]
MTEPELRVLIVDDEPHARERLAHLLGELPNCDVVGQCGTGIEALNQVGELEPSVVLLDIRMPGMSGIETARHLSALPDSPAVVFTTAYDEYAMDAFDAQAVGYLLKPVRKERLERALLQAGRLSVSQLKLVAASEQEVAQRQHIAIRARDELRLIPVKDILFFCADQKYVSVHHDGGEDLIDESLTELADEFAPEFSRVHRSTLVSVSHVEALERDREGRHFVRIRGRDELLPVGRRQVGDLKRLLTAR